MRMLANALPFTLGRLYACISRYNRIRLTAITAALALMLVMANTAHAASNTAYSWESGTGKCVETTSGIGSGEVSSQATGVKEQWARWGVLSCHKLWYRTIYSYRAGNVLMRWTGSSWAACAIFNWRYSPQDSATAWSHDRYRPSAPCDPGYYSNFGWGQTWWDGAYQGRYVYSGYEYYY